MVFRYASPDGARDPAWNVNGSTNAIAGIVNERGNVLGMMPHPENHVEASIGSTDGRGLFAGLAEALKSRVSGDSLCRAYCAGAPSWKRVLAAILDFFTVFFAVGWSIGRVTGNTTDSGFKLEGGPALVLFAAGRRLFCHRPSLRRGHALGSDFPRFARPQPR